MGDGNWVFVTAAYGATWVVMVSYWMHAHRALGRARAALEHSSAGRKEES